MAHHTRMQSEKPRTSTVVSTTKQIGKSFIQCGRTPGSSEEPELVKLKWFFLCARGTSALALGGACFALPGKEPGPCSLSLFTSGGCGDAVERSAWDVTCWCHVAFKVSQPVCSEQTAFGVASAQPASAKKPATSEVAVSPPLVPTRPSGRPTRCAEPRSSCSRVKWNGGLFTGYKGLGRGEAASEGRHRGIARSGACMAASSPNIAMPASPKSALQGSIFAGALRLWHAGCIGRFGANRGIALPWHAACLLCISLVSR